MSPNEATCLLVCKVIAADGDMSEDERGFLGGLMSRLDLDDAQRKRVLALEGADEAETLCKQRSDDEKREILELLVDAAGSDGNLSKVEMTAMKGVSKALGL